MSDLISQALKTATDTKEFRAGEGIIGEVSELFLKWFPSKRALIVADETTWRVCGARVMAVLAEAGVSLPKPYIFPAEPVPAASYENLCEVRKALEDAGSDAVAVAVGSGTINDLCKRASFELSRKYMCVATASSVDGYASFGAPITQEGFKKTWPCDAPLAILADTDVLLSAPKELAASGYADLMAKVVSGADWILADAVLEDPIREDVWATTQVPLRSWIDNPELLANGDADAMTRLFTGLAMTGFAMQTTHTSRPASGAEHLLSHHWEMLEITMPDGTHPSHGYKVGIGVILSAKLMEYFFSEPFTADDIERAVAEYPDWETREAAIRDLLPEGRIADEAVEASKAKHLTNEQLRARLTIIAERYDELKKRVLAQILPSEEFVRRLKIVGAPSLPAEIGVSDKVLVEGVRGAQMIRNRYTILDLVFDAGRLNKYAARLVDNR